MVVDIVWIPLEFFLAAELAHFVSRSCIPMIMTIGVTIKISFIDFTHIAICIVISITIIILVVAFFNRVFVFHILFVVTVAGVVLVIGFLHFANM